jgi:hypothetical protein
VGVARGLADGDGVPLAAIAPDADGADDAALGAGALGDAAGPQAISPRLALSPRTIDRRRRIVDPSIPGADRPRSTG